MASVIKIKRSGTAGGAPGSLKSGELAYTYTNGVDRLYFGKGDDGSGNATSIVQVGGEFYTGLLTVTAGTVTASKAVIVDASKKVNEWLVDNITLDGNTISSTDTNGNLVLDPNGTGLIALDSATVRVGNNNANAVITTQGTGDLTLSTNNGTDSGTIVIADGVDANITITPNGAGKISLDGQLWPNALGTVDQYLKTDASGVLSWASIPSGSFTIAAESGTSQSFTTGNTFTVAAGEGIDTAVSIVGSDVTVTVSGEDASDTNKGIASFSSTNFTVTTGAVSINDEYVQDTVGAMVSSNTESNISVTYDDTNGKLDFSVATATTGVLGVASFDTNNFTVTAGAVSAKSITLGTTVLDLGSADLTLAGLQQLTVDNIDVNGNTISSTNTDGNIVLDPNGTGTVDVSSARITNLATPTQATDAATKAYVDATKSGLDVKDSVRLATTAALTVTYANGTAGLGATLTNADTQAALTLDGVPAVAGDRVLIKNQATALQNGIYTVTDIGSGSTNWVLTRATDFDEDAEVTGGAFTFVEAGNTQADNGYVMTANGIIDVGTNDITFVQFSGAGQITAGGGLTKTGNTLDVGAGDGITVNADTVALATTVAGDGLTYTTGVLAVGGTADRISVTANAVDIASTYAGQGTIVTLGTVTSGTWNANTVTVAYGGTGATTLTSNGVLYGNGTGAVQATAAGTDGYFLYSNAGTPAWTNTVDGGTY